MRSSWISTVVLAVLLSVPLAAVQARDAAVTVMVVASLQGYTGLTIFDDVSVKVVDHIVTLTGKVTMPFKRDEIERRLARIDGVYRVINNIDVLPASTTDAGLRTRVAQAIYSHPAFWQYAAMANPPIHIVVERGRVTLTGCVNNQLERSLAFALAQVPGAMNVANQLRLDR